jgi:hypothetical protein
MSAQLTDSSYAALARQIVVDSLRGGGHRADETYIATDSATARLLRIGGMSAVSVHAPPIAIDCPDAALTAASVSPVGYGVTVTDSAGVDPDHRWLRASVGCTYVGAPRSGGRRGFGESGVWEIRRTQAGWIVIKRLEHWVT